VIRGFHDLNSSANIITSNKSRGTSGPRGAYGGGRERKRNTQNFGVEIRKGKGDLEDILVDEINNKSALIVRVIEQLYSV
jgi:hypothetical protein